MRQSYKIGLWGLGASAALTGTWLAVAGITYSNALSEIDSKKLIESADAIVVLTGSKGRIEAARQLRLKDSNTFLLISGLKNDNRPALQYGEYAGYWAQDTIGNALETKNWIDFMAAEKKKIETLILVTSRLHMPRALAEMKQALPDDIQIYPYVVSGPSSFSHAFSEANKYLLTVTGMSSFLRTTIGRLHLAKHAAPFSSPDNKIAG